MNSMKNMKLGDVELEYVLSANENKDTILFVHGLGANLSQFENQHGFFKKKFQVLTVNLRGHGESTSLPDQGKSPFKLSDFAKDLILLLDELNIPKVHFVGNSMGGNVGYEFLQNNPERLLSLVTFGTTAKIKKSKLTVFILKLVYRLMNQKILAKLSAAAGVKNSSKEKIKEMMQKVNKKTILQLLILLANFNYLPVITTAEIPAMIIKGGKDKEINNVLESTLKSWQNHDIFEVIEIKNAGHFANLDNPEEFNKVLEQFVEKID